MADRPIIQEGEIYHVYNRGVEKRNIFLDSTDYVRFIHNLFEFNDARPAPEFKRRYQPGDYVGDRNSHIRKRIVDILCFCLMKNHYHLVVRPLTENALGLFMRKLGIGYAMAFNAKIQRVGPLFQGRYKVKHVASEEYLRNLICYIHANPLKFLKRFDKSRRLDFSKTWEELNRFRWSSHNDHLGKENFGSVIEKQFILNLFGGSLGYKEFMEDWIRNEAEKLESVVDIAIDL